MNDKKHDRSGGVVGPLILIALGVVFLLNNLGIVSWSVWGILLRLWPVLLIAAGLDLILGRRSVWGSLLALLLTFAMLGAALWLSQTGASSARAARTEEIVQPLDDAQQAELAIDPGVGRLDVGAAADSPNLIEGTVDLARQERLTQDVTVREQEVSFTLRTQGTSFGPFTTGWAATRLWDLKLSPRIPLHLKANLGVGEMDLDLSELTLEALDVELGIGQTVISLPPEGRFTARVEGAIGQTIVVVPEALAARVRWDTGITGRQVPEDYRCEEVVCTSPGYDAADDRVDLEVSQAIGNLVIRH